MKEYMIINDADGNDTFTVRAENSEEAAHKALEQLGWWVAKGEEVDEEEEVAQESKDRKNGLYGAEYEGEKF